MPAPMPPTELVTDDPRLGSTHCAWCVEPITVGVVTSAGLVFHPACRRLRDVVTGWAEQALDEHRPTTAHTAAPLDVHTDELGELLDEVLTDQDLRVAV